MPRLYYNCTIYARILRSRFLITSSALYYVFNQTTMRRRSVQNLLAKAVNHHHDTALLPRGLHSHLNVTPILREAVYSLHSLCVRHGELKLESKPANSQPNVSMSTELNSRREDRTQTLNVEDYFDDDPGGKIVFNT